MNAHVETGFTSTVHFMSTNEKGFYFGKLSFLYLTFDDVNCQVGLEFYEFGQNSKIGEN